MDNVGLEGAGEFLGANVTRGEHLTNGDEQMGRTCLRAKSLYTHADIPHVGHISRPSPFQL